MSSTVAKEEEEDDNGFARTGFKVVRHIIPPEVLAAMQHEADLLFADATEQGSVFSSG